MRYVYLSLLLLTACVDTPRTFLIKDNQYVTCGGVEKSAFGLDYRFQESRDIKCVEQYKSHGWSVIAP